MGCCFYHLRLVRIARIFNTYGPRMCLDDGRVVSNFVAQPIRKQPLTVYMEMETLGISAVVSVSPPAVVSRIYYCVQAEMKRFAGADTSVLKLHYEKKVLDLEQEKKTL
ncbi:hypothetical protein POM88_016348 [Heracleum sosnowskyi]|uniref:Uncharacterized protein n=1 Tax=Heracleum sosnowskyi TaxID=360622 RepID=A0AAD8MSW2_9APIA|nr:hypothetical protein POM88_016348 [Heracleum sosnowskyi]